MARVAAALAPSAASAPPASAIQSNAPLSSPTRATTRKMRAQPLVTRAASMSAVPAPKTMAARRARVPTTVPMSDAVTNPSSTRCRCASTMGGLLMSAPPTPTAASSSIPPLRSSATSPIRSHVLETTQRRSDTAAITLPSATSPAPARPTPGSQTEGGGAAMKSSVEGAAPAAIRMRAARPPR